MTPPEQGVHLEAGNARLARIQRFADRLTASGLPTLQATALEVLQVNVGKLCNQSCRHCHVDAGPTRREVMTRQTMQDCLAVLQRLSDLGRVPTLDITGGAPEMNPNFRWFVAEARKLGAPVMVRCNLTILVAGGGHADLPEFYARQGVHVVSSLPHYAQSWTDRQRGDHVYEKSIAALKRLNAVGFGREGSELLLDLVHNPVGAFMPGGQSLLESEYRRELKARHDIEFNRLYTITNMPIARFLEALIQAGKLESYLELLVEAFNPAAVAGVMCRTQLSVSWDGRLYDCDFNQMLELGLTASERVTIGDLAVRPDLLSGLVRRAISTGQHCYGCTAGAGSSCGGVTELAPSPMTPEQ
jgi:radical SAM/Cys-rich protein